MTPSPPFLVIREGLSFWVERQAASAVSITLQAFDEGCYSGALIYDGEGCLWPVESATLKVQPTFIDRLLPWRLLPVELHLGVPVAAGVSEIFAKLERILLSEKEFADSLQEPREVCLKRLQTARSAYELIVIAALLE
jgi:hypothetical protein